MAKLIGAVKFVGKFNDAVGIGSRRGKSFVRSAAASVANPRSLGQSIQRMILATAGQSIGYLKEICNNSVEGKANGNDTLSYLRSQWMRMLRVSDINSSPYNYAKKGSGIFVINPYQLSKGTLLAPAYSCDGSQSTLVCAEINAAATKASELLPSIAVGNQITIVSVALDDSELTPGDAYIPVVKYCRFAFKNDFTAPLVDGTLNPDAIDMNKAEGDWGKLIFANGSIDLSEFVGNIDLAACALIVSNVAEKKRSTSYLALANNVLGLQFPAVDAYPTFGNVATPIDVPSEVYLDNSTTPSTAGLSTDITLPANVTTIGGKHVTLLGSATINQLRFDTGNPQPLYLSNGVLTDGDDSFNTYNVSNGVITFGVFSESGPDLTRIYLVTE